MNNHSIFSYLRDVQHDSKPELEAQNIFAISNGEIFVWNHFNSSIITFNLKFLIGKTENEANASSFQVKLELFIVCCVILLI